MLPVLGNLGFANTTFGDSDFAAIGIVIGKIGEKFGMVGIYVLMGLIVGALFVPSILKKSDKPVNAE